MLKEVQSKKDSDSQSLDLPLTFLDRQRLQLLEDKILDSSIIFESIQDTLGRLKRQCGKHCLKDMCVDCKCATTCDDFEDFEHDVQLNLKKTKTLHKRVKGVTQLVNYLVKRCILLSMADETHSSQIC